MARSRRGLSFSLRYAVPQRHHFAEMGQPEGPNATTLLMHVIWVRLCNLNELEPWLNIGPLIITNCNHILLWFTFWPVY